MLCCFNLLFKSGAKVQNSKRKAKFFCIFDKKDASNLMSLASLCWMIRWKTLFASAIDVLIVNYLISSVSSMNFKFIVNVGLMES